MLALLLLQLVFQSLCRRLEEARLAFSSIIIVEMPPSIRIQEDALRVHPFSDAQELWRLREHPVKGCSIRGMRFCPVWLPAVLKE
jgi:hypothetical protein